MSKTPAPRTDDEIIATHMRGLAKKRWAKKTKEQRAEEQRAKILKRHRSPLA
jgi:hypothetical protein